MASALVHGIAAKLTAEEYGHLSNVPGFKDELKRMKAAHHVPPPAVSVSPEPSQPSREREEAVVVLPEISGVIPIGFVSQNHPGPASGIGFVSQNNIGPAAAIGLASQNPASRPPNSLPALPEAA